MEDAVLTHVYFPFLEVARYTLYPDAPAVFFHATFMAFFFAVSFTPVTLLGRTTSVLDMDSPEPAAGLTVTFATPGYFAFKMPSWVAEITLVLEDLVV